MLCPRPHRPHRDFGSTPRLPFRAGDSLTQQPAWEGGISQGTTTHRSQTGHGRAEGTGRRGDDESLAFFEMWRPFFAPDICGEFPKLGLETHAVSTLSCTLDQPVGDAWCELGGRTWSYDLRSGPACTSASCWAR